MRPWFCQELSQRSIVRLNPEATFARCSSWVEDSGSKGTIHIQEDAYADGDMEMKAKILSTITVVDETETPELNQTSLQRWLLMTPLYPTALLPGGRVSWEPVDGSHARAIVEAHGF